MSKKRQQLLDLAKKGKITPEQMGRMAAITEEILELAQRLDEQNAQLRQRLEIVEAAPRIGCDLCNWTGHLDEVDVVTGETWRVWCQCSDRAAETLAGL